MQRIHGQRFFSLCLLHEAQDQLPRATEYCAMLLCLSVLQALAALVQGRARGLLATSSDLDITLLQKCFELDDYDFLVKVEMILGQ